MLRFLESLFQLEIEEKRLVLIRGSVLDVEIPPFTKCVANIPYYISSDLLQLFILSKRLDATYTLLVQKEFAEKLMVSKKHDSTFLSTFVQSYFHIEYQFNVSRYCFSPPPSVESAVITMKPNPSVSPACIANPQKYQSFLRACFRSKKPISAKESETVERISTNRSVVSALGVVK